MIELTSVEKVYRKSGQNIKALDEVNLRVEKGAFLAINGPSGSGKTTLLMTIGAMLRPTSGTVRIDGIDIYRQSESERTKLRAERIGFVFQMFHLLPYLTTLENVLLSAGPKAGRYRERAVEILQRLRLSDRIDHRPGELSAGEKQRTALARAMLTEPQIILADEPTGNLDEESAAEVLGYLSEFHRKGGTVVLVTHGKDANQYADRVVHLKNGRLAEN